MSVYAGPETITSGLVLSLDAGNPKSYSGSGTAWYDLSDNRNHTTLTNGPTYSSGVMSFDNVDDYVVTNNTMPAFGTGDFTLEVWIRPDSFSSYTHMIALPNQATFTLKATRVGDGVAGTIYFYSGSFTTYDSTPGWQLTLNVWQQVILKRESSVAYAFLNGVSKGSKTGFTNDFSTPALLSIHNGYVGEFTQCSMSNIKVYNRALSSTEINQNFNALRGRFGI